MELHKLLEGKVVNCRTEEEAKDLLLFFHENGCKWAAGNSLIDKNYWYEYSQRTCYHLRADAPF